MRTIKHATVAIMILDGGVEDDAPNSLNDPGNPRNASDLNRLKAERTRGRKAGEVELGEEVFGRENGGGTGKHKHINFPEGKDFHFNSTSAFFVYNRPFYRIKGLEGERKEDVECSSWYVTSNGRGG